MASLKTKIVEIPVPPEGAPENRDAGRKYLLTEMPVLKAERWARHAVSAMNRHDLNAREEIAQLGMLGFYLVGLQALAGGDIEAVDKLMDQMLDQIQIIEEHGARPCLAEGDFWELSTLKTLRVELIELHMGFTFAELASILAASAPTPTNSQSASTSPAS